MSEIPLDVLKAASELNRDRYVKAILEGDSERASEHLHKMTYALQQIEQYETEGESKWAI